MMASAKCKTAEKTSSLTTAGWENTARELKRRVKYLVRAGCRASRPGRPCWRRTAAPTHPQASSSAHAPHRCASPAERSITTDRISPYSNRFPFYTHPLPHLEGLTHACLEKHPTSSSHAHVPLAQRCWCRPCRIGTGSAGTAAAWSGWDHGKYAADKASVSRSAHIYANAHYWSDNEQTQARGHGTPRRRELVLRPSQGSGHPQPDWHETYQISGRDYTPLLLPYVGLESRELQHQCDEQVQDMLQHARVERLADVVENQACRAAGQCSELIHRRPAKQTMCDTHERYTLTLIDHAHFIRDTHPWRAFRRDSLSAVLLQGVPLLT